MKKSIRTSSCILLAVLVAGSAFGQEMLQLTRQDGKTTLVKTYYSKNKAFKGIAIISPGAGGSADGYAYLARYFSSSGWLALVVGHEESGRAVVARKALQAHDVREGLLEVITDPSAYQARFMDISAARQWALARHPAARTVLIGHSMGAATTMLEAGARNNLGLHGNDAFDAYIALSPQGAGEIFPENAWQDIRKPFLTITGTRDSDVKKRSWQTRLEPFNAMPAGHKWAAVVDGATHMNFAGKGLSGTTEQLVTRTIGAFLESLHTNAAPAPAQGIEIRAK